MAQDNPPPVPVQHKYTVEVNRQALGFATYTLRRDGEPVPGFVGLSGGWDDTTPVPNNTYDGTFHGAYGDGSPSWSLDPAFLPKRDGILLHSDFGYESSKTSVGCLVAPPKFLQKINELIGQDNIKINEYNALIATGEFPGTRPVPPESRNIKISLTGEDQPANITLSAITTDANSQDKSGNSNSFVKLQLGLTKPLSKDVWVFIKVDNPDDTNHTEFTSSNFDKSVLVLDSKGKLLTDPGAPLNLGDGSQSGYVGYQLDIMGDKGLGSRNPGDRSKNGFWVRIPAGQTSEEIDVKPAYKNTPGPARTETFTVADYGIVYDGAVRRDGSGRAPTLYQDGLNGADAHASNLLTGGQRAGASVDFKITDEATSASGLYKTFILPIVPAPGQTFASYRVTGGYKSAGAWTFDVDPDKSHTLTAYYAIGSAGLDYVDASVQTLDGRKSSLTLNSRSGDGFTVYSIDPKQLQGTEGQITIEAKRDDPHGFTFSVDDPAQQPLSPTPNLIRSPDQLDQLQANFTPGGTGTPNTTTWNYDNGVTTITTTDATGNVIYREIDNADATREVEIYQITDQPFTSSDRMYDANSNVTSTTLYKANDTAYLSGTGILNADGTTTVSLVDASGVIAGFEVDYPFVYMTYQFGPKAVTLYTTAGQPFPAVESDYGPAGDLQLRKYFDATGAVYETETVTITPDGWTVGNFYDVTGTLIETRVTGLQGRPYTATDTTYDSFGNIVLITRYGADGSVYETGTVAVASNGTTTTVYDDVSGALAEQDVVNSDGSKQISIFNIVGEPYSSSVTNYDPYGRITSQTFDYAGGNIYQSTTYDPTTGNTTILTYDISGNLSTKEIDNGTRDITTYGITGEPYSSMEVLYDFEGNVVSQKYYNNDGTSEVIQYPLPYASGPKTDTIYNADGKLTSQAIFNTDGSVASTQTVVWNADGSSTVQYRNGAGLLTSQEIDGADGSRDVTVYDAPGQTLPSTEDVYDASQTLLSTTVRNADGSRNETIFGITGQIYVTAQTFYDPSGEATAQNFSDSNGMLVQSDAIAHAADGSTITRLFDGSGVLTGQQVVNANGSADFTAYGDRGISYVKSVSHFSTTGALVSETFYNGDGSVQQIETVTSNSDGSGTTDITDAGGHLTSRTTTAADGSSEVLNYGPATSVQSDTFYDALGNVRSATIYNGDGTVNETESVTANADGSTITSLFDATGTLVRQSVKSADGSGTTTVFGITDEHYHSTVEAIDANGVTVSDSYLNNDGTRDVVTYPVNGPYAQLDSHYDASGVLLTKQLLNDSGVIVLTGAVTTNTEGSVTTRYVDSTDTLAEIEVDRADGTSSITNYGVTGEPYTSTQTEYDATGNVTSASYFNADGSLYQSETVMANTDDGSTTLNFYDATATLLETDVDAADGSRDVAIFGIAGRNYTSTDSQYDASGTLLSQTRNNANGTRDVLNCGISDPNFASSDSYYDATGTLLTKTLLKADGSTYLVGTAITDAGGVVTIDYPDDSRNLLRQEIDNPDGSREVQIYQITSEPYTSTDTRYYGSGNAGVETFYNSDYSVYRTDYFNFNSDGSGGEAFYDSNFRYQEQDTFYSDGSKEVYLANSPQPYADTDSIYNPDGSLASATVTNSDGSTRADVYGIKNEPYVSTSTLYNFAGQLSSVTRLNADGSVYQIGTLASQAAIGTYTINYVNADGVLASVETARIDGTSSITTSLITGEPYVSATSNYDANGNLTSETFFNADGSTYSSTHSVYDAGGHFVAEAFFNGDGSVDHTINVSNIVTTTNYFDAGGALDHKTVANADGTNSLIQYGIAGQTYSSTERDFDASGTLTQLTSFEADGSRQVDAYGITGQPFASTQSDYDASGRLSSEKFYKADGTVYLVQDSVVNADGSTTTTGIDSTGLVVSRTIQNTDGTSIDYAYGITGQAYASTVSDYDINGSLTSETFYAADGSVYQTEVATTDANGTTTSTLTDADGSLASTNVVAADGSNVLTIYGIVGKPYTSMSALYGVNGNLTFETFYKADGSIYETDRVTETANTDGSTTVTYVSSNGTTTTYTYNADGTPGNISPSVAVAINSNDINAANPTGLVTFTFSEAPTAFTLADTSAVGGSLSNLSGSGTSYTATFTAAAGTDINNASVSVTAGSWQETNGNPGSGSSTSPFTVDTVTPTVAVAINNNDVNAANPTGLVTFTFSEAPTSFSLADTSAVGGSLSNLSGSGTSYTATFTGAAGTDINNASVSVTAGSWQETNGNPGSGSSTSPFMVDTVTPTVAVAINNNDVNAANPTGLVTFTFSEAPNSFSLSDTAAVGGTLSNLSGSGTNYTATFTAAAGTDINNASVSVTGGSWQETNGNPGAGGGTLPFTVDTLTPTVAVAINSTDLNVASPIGLVTFTFSEAPLSFSLADTSAVGGTLSNLSGTGISYTATFTASAGTDTNNASVSVTTGSWQEGNGNAGAGGGTSPFTVDTVTPTVSVAINSSDVNVANPTGLVTFTFSEAPTALTLADVTAIGGALSNLSGSGTSYTATFSAVAGTDINNASVSVTAGSWQEANGNQGAGGGTSLFTVDTLTPAVSSISTSPSSGDENTGNIVHLMLTMNKTVSVTGTPALALNDGGTAVYQSGSGSNNLVFAYTVANGQNTSALAVTGNNLNGSSIAITDADGNAADLTGADTTFPGLKIGATVSSVTATPSSGDLGPGKVITLAVTTSEPVTITGGTPTLSLNDGGVATYKSGSGTSVLNFSYTVGALGSGQNTAALAVTGFNANGATIYDSGVLADTADLTGVTSFVAGPQIDTTAATVSSVVTNPATGDLAAGQSVTLTVNFSESVVVTGSPLVSLNDGGKATYVGGSGSNALTFTYTVAAGQNTPDLTVTALSANGGTIKDGAGNNAVLTGAVTNPAGILQIDTKAPLVTEKLVSDTGASASDKISSNDALSGGGDANATVQLTIDGVSSAVTATASSTGAWTFTPAGLADGSHTVVASETDGAGNTATASLAFTLDTTAPTATAIAANPANGDLDAGNAVSLTVQFSEAVYATATSYLLLNDGGKATYAGGSGSTTLTFTYTVAAGQNTVNLAVTGLSTGLTDVAGNAALLAGAATNPGGTLQIDTTAPKITSIATSGSGIVAGKGDLGPGKTVTLTSNFGENVLVNTAGGVPTLALNDGGTATYAGGSGSSSLTFVYTVGALGSGQDIADLKLATTGAVSLNGGLITDVAGNAAVLTAANNYNPVGVLQIDTTAPTVTTVVSSPATGNVTTGHVVKITLSTNEAVSVSGTPQLFLNDGGVANYDAAHSTSKALVFNYTVAAGEVTTRLAVSGIEVPTDSAIADLAGNTATLSGAAVSLGVQINTTSTGPAGPAIGNLTLSGSSDAELFGASSANVTFASGSTGTLKLDASTQFAGTVAGLALGNYIDFADLAYQGNSSPVYSSSGTNTGTLAVTEGGNTINVALLGNYFASSFVASSDGHGGTLVTDPPPPPSQMLFLPMHA